MAKSLIVIKHEILEHFITILDEYKNEMIRVRSNRNPREGTKIEGELQKWRNNEVKKITKT